MVKYLMLSLTSKEYELTLKKNDTFYLLDFLSKEHFDLNLR